MNGAELIVDFLKRKGVNHAFGYPGGPIIVLYDAIYKAKFPHILTRHEQGAAHAAEGFAKATGIPGVVIATSGPGATNLVTGLADAMLDSVPMLAITGAVARKATGTDAFQEADITGITQPITKYNYLVMNPDELVPILEEAWDLATQGRPGPVLVNVPKDIMAMEINTDSSGQALATSTYVRHRPASIRTASMADQVYAAINNSKKPMILAGGGCIISKGATEDLKRFAECTGIPVATTLMGKGAMKEDHPLYLGNLGMHGTPQANKALGTCDLLLAVGTRFSDRIIGDPEIYSQDTTRFVVHVDVDAAEIGKNVKAGIQIEDDAADFFETMLASLPDAKTCGKLSDNWKPWLDQLMKIKGRYEELKKPMYEPTTPLQPQYVIHEAAKGLKGQDPILVTDVGQHQMFASQHFPVESPRSWITSGGLGTMGFGIPAAMGTATAYPDRTTVLFVGDGGFQMTLQELGVIASHRMPVKIFVMDNSCLGMVRQWQELFYDERYSHTLLESNPDFLKIAEAYGMRAGRAADPESLKREITAAYATDGPYLIHVVLDSSVNVYPMIPAGKLPNDIIMPGLEDQD
ncbi:MAG: biosynthetic-type acetolactate synthase large subunit [Clostridiaceae bacterium]|nr:biosynthetic-type acetolactate synthase large subunit [Clostridiaceae bacterium]